MIPNDSVFVSYSWDDELHIQWVKNLVKSLRTSGLRVAYDDGRVQLGKSSTRFMEEGIRDSRYVIVVCTPTYKARADGRKGGVGFEGQIMSAELLQDGNIDKFIPVLRGGDWDTALPTFLAARWGADLSDDPYDQRQFDDLVATITKASSEPATGLDSRMAIPASGSLQRAGDSGEEFEPIRITGVIVDEIGIPANDGSRGSALYSVPIGLSSAPSIGWSDLFVRTWDHPPRYGTRHRRGIARVSGSRIVLSRTTIEEVGAVHRDTLVSVVAAVNSSYAALLDARAHAEADKADAARHHRERVQDEARRIRFD